MDKQRLQELAGVPLNEQISDDFHKQTVEFRKLLQQNELIDAREAAKEFGWPKQTVMNELYGWFLHGDKEI